jgi:anti-anti-sigma factor
MLEDFYPVEWAGGQAVVLLPEHIEASNAGQVREELLSVINRGATTLIADMTTTTSCDHAGVDAVVRAYQRAVSSGTELRLVVTARIVSQALSRSGLDRLVSVYSSREAAMGAGPSAAVSANGNGAAPVRARRLQDGVALAAGDGTIAAASARMEDMFGYGPAELPGRPVESLVPGGLQAARRVHRGGYAGAPGNQVPGNPPVGGGAQLAGLRKDGTTFTVRISLTPVTIAAGQFILAVIRDITSAPPAEDLAGGDVAAEQEYLGLLVREIRAIAFSVSGRPAVPLPIVPRPREPLDDR